MDDISIVLIIAVCVLLAAVIALSIMHFRSFTPEQRGEYLNACQLAVQTVIDAVRDGKITQAELISIAHALLNVAAAFAKTTPEDIAESLQVDEIYCLDKTNEAIDIKKDDKEKEYEKKQQEYEHKIEELKKQDIYADGRFEKMVEWYYQHGNGEPDASLARISAMCVLGYDAYRKLDATAQSALISNIMHGHIDTA